MDKDKKETLQLIFSGIIMIVLLVILVLVITDKISFKKKTNTVTDTNETSNVVETTSGSEVYNFYGEWRFSGALLDDNEYDANMLFGSCLKENSGKIIINQDGTFSISIGCTYELSGTYEIKSNENIVLTDQDNNNIDVSISSDLLKFEYSENYDDLDVDGIIYLKFIR